MSHNPSVGHSYRSCREHVAYEQNGQYLRASEGSAEMLASKILDSGISGPDDPSNAEGILYSEGASISEGIAAIA
jgi:hypothetical protein